LLQLATDKRVYLFRLNKCGFTDTGKKNYCSRLLHGDDKPICVMRLDYSAYRP
jgi:hypothetical protein